MHLFHWWCWGHTKVVYFMSFWSLIRIWLSRIIKFFSKWNWGTLIEFNIHKISSLLFVWLWTSVRRILVAWSWHWGIIIPWIIHLWKGYFAFFLDNTIPLRIPCFLRWWWIKTKPIIPFRRTYRIPELRRFILNTPLLLSLWPIISWIPPYIIILVSLISRISLLELRFDPGLIHNFLVLLLEWHVRIAYSFFLIFWS